MSSTTMPQQDAVASTRPYRAVWRWHFCPALVRVDRADGNRMLARAADH